jgi:hypothetical protein
MFLCASSALLVGVLNSISLCDLCALCVCGELLSGVCSPQRHREHKGCTEKTSNQDPICQS